MSESLCTISGCTEATSVMLGGYNAYCVLHKPYSRGCSTPGCTNTLVETSSMETGRCIDCRTSYGTQAPYKKTECVLCGAKTIPLDNRANALDNSRLTVGGSYARSLLQKS